MTNDAGGRLASGKAASDKYTHQQRRVLLVAVLASFVAVLDGSVVNLALPSIARDLGGGLSSQQWTVDAYLLTLGAFMLVAGSLSDVYGRVRVLQIGLIGFAVTSLLCGLAAGATILGIARALQGLAGALMVPSSLALIMSAFRGRAQNRAVGIWTAATGAATIVSPLIGGVAVDALSWRFIFFINLLPIAVALVLLSGLRALNVRHGASRVDYPGAALAVVGLGGPVFALIEQGRLGWEHPAVWVPLAAGLVALGLFLRHEARTEAPMLPLGLFAMRNFSVGNVSTFAIYGALSFGLLVLTLYLLQVARLSATATGIALLPGTVLLLLLSPLFGSLSGKLGPRLFMSAGPALAGGGFLLLLAIDEPFNYWWQVFPGLLVFGLGLAVTVAPLTSAILGALPESVAGIGSAINNAVARVAGLITTACAGIIIGPVLDLEALHRCLAVTAGLLLIGGAVSAAGIRQPKRTLTG